MKLDLKQQRSIQTKYQRSNEFCIEKLLTLIFGGFLEYIMSKLENMEQSAISKWKMHFSTGNWECFLFHCENCFQPWPIRFDSRNSSKYQPMKMGEFLISVW